MSQEKGKYPYPNGQRGEVKADPEVTVTAKRRQFTRAYKLRILAEVEQCQRGEIGALLRREGLYSSTLSKWRQQQAEGELDKEDTKTKAAKSEQSQEVKRLRRENAQLQARLKKAEAIIEVQKKLSALLGLDS